MESVEFVKGLDSVFNDNDLKSGENTLLILDDLASELSGNPKASKLFTQGIHRKNVSIVFKSVQTGKSKTFNTTVSIWSFLKTAETSIK